jgi:hypothetical protein
MILIQKPYIPIFVNYLNLSKFEYVFGLNLNFEFKFKLAEKKFEKLFYSCLSCFLYRRERLDSRTHGHERH